MTLDEIAIKHGTDKATQHPVKGHGYTPNYESVFSPIRELPIKLLEIGVGGGESIRTWLEFFPNARVFGVDIVQGTNEWNTVGAKTHHRYTFVTGSQSDPTFWKCFVSDYGKAWDVIIDDGGHFSDQVITSFDGLWKSVSKGGLYCVEDLGVAYGAGSIFLTKNWPGHMDFIRDRLDDVNLGRNGVKLMNISMELVIIQKY